MTEKLHRSLLIKELKEVFPSICEELNDQDGLLTLEVSVFRDLAQRAIDNQDKAITRKCFSIAGKYYRSGTQEMVNAIGLSFAKDMNLSDSKKNFRSWALELLPNDLKSIYNDFNG